MIDPNRLNQFLGRGNLTTAPGQPQQPVAPMTPTPGGIDPNVFSQFMGGGAIAPSATPTVASPGQYLSGGIISDIFDVAQTFQFGAAGVATGRGFRRGIAERTSFGELLPPEFRQTLPGIAVEFAMNVLGDPLTYIPVGGLAVRGLRALPGGPGAIRGFKAGGRAVFEPLGLALPQTTRAARTFAQLDVPSMERMRELQREVRVLRFLGDETAVEMAQGMRKEAAALAGAKRADELMQDVGLYFDAPAGAMLRTAKALFDLREEYVTQLAGFQRRAGVEVAQQAKVVRGLFFKADNPKGGLFEIVGEPRVHPGLPGVTTAPIQTILIRSIGTGATERYPTSFLERVRPMGLRDVRATAQRMTGQITEELPLLTDDEIVTLGRQAGEAARVAFIESLPKETREFVVRWGERLIVEHGNDLDNLVRIGVLSPKTAERWKGMYLRREFLRFRDPEAWAMELAESDPFEATKLISQLERQPMMQGAGITLKRPQARVEVSPELDAYLGILGADKRFLFQKRFNTELVARYDFYQKIASEYALSDDAVQVLSQHPEFVRTFRQIGSELSERATRKPFGPLQGKWVPKEVYDEIIAAHQDPSFLQKALGLWKAAKITTPAFLGRNLRSIMTQQVPVAVGIHAVNPLRWVDAAREVLTKGPVYKEFRQISPAMWDSLTQVEAGRMVQSLDRFAGSGNPLLNMLTTVVKAYAMPIHKAAVFEEQVGRLFIYKVMREGGFSPTAAALKANLSMVNYQDVPPLIRKLSRSGMYPFIIFPYGIMTGFVPGALEAPGRAAAVVKGFRAATDEYSPEELRALPPDLRSGAVRKIRPGLLTVLPWLKDASGRPVAYDLTYELVFGDIAESGTPLGQIAKALRGEEPMTAAMGSLLTPIGQAIAELWLNRSFFTGQELRRAGEPGTVAAVRHVARTALPSTVFAAGETVLAETGALSQLGATPSSSLARAVTGTPSSRGIGPPSPASALSSLAFGTRTLPIDLGQEQVARAREFRGAMADLDAEILRVARDQSIRDERLRGRRLEALRRRRVELARRYQSEGFVRR